MPFDRRIYHLSPAKLSAETIAVTFAKTSRSPKAFDEIAGELNEEKSSKFSEKWIVGYGHSSVAEHAVLHLAIENVSRLAIECIEGNRLASYTEKSTRYQEWDRQAYVIPAEISGSRWETPYLQTLNQLFDAYETTIPKVKHVVEQRIIQGEGETANSWRDRVRTTTIDVCRFLLPAASVANVGVTINARALEYAIRKMLGSDLDEVRLIGEEVKRVATQEVPTLVKYATPLTNLDQFEQSYKTIDKDSVHHIGDIWCRLLQIDPNGERKVLAGLLYRFGDKSYDDYLDDAIAFSQQEFTTMVAELFMNSAPFDVPPRELEYTGYTFDLIMDQGAYFEFKRHRMMSQTPQRLSTKLGFAVPREIAEAGCLDIYTDAMRNASLMYEQLVRYLPAVASYIVPNGFNRRVLCALNLRELFHFAKLRCNANAHFSIRRIGRGMVERIQKEHPVFSAHLCVGCQETSDSIAKEYFLDIAAH